MQASQEKPMSGVKYGLLKRSVNRQRYFFDSSEWSSGRSFSPIDEKQQKVNEPYEKYIEHNSPTRDVDNNFNIVCYDASD